jgi:hypothetical protein
MKSSAMAVRAIRKRAKENQRFISLALLPYIADLKTPKKYVIIS